MVKIKSQTAIIDYEEYEGDTLIMDLTWQDSAGIFFDLTSHSAKMQVRVRAGGDVALVTLENAPGITLGNAASNLVVKVSPAQTTLIGAGRFYYDIELTDLSGNVNTLVAGKLILIESVTK